VSEIFVKMNKGWLELESDPGIDYRMYINT